MSTGGVTRGYTLKLRLHLGRVGHTSVSATLTASDLLATNSTAFGAAREGSGDLGINMWGLAKMERMLLGIRIRLLSRNDVGVAADRSSISLSVIQTALHGLRAPCFSIYGRAL